MKRGKGRKYFFAYLLMFTLLILSGCGKNLNGSYNCFWEDSTDIGLGNLVSGSSLIELSIDGNKAEMTINSYDVRAFSSNVEKKRVVVKGKVDTPKEEVTFSKNGEDTKFSYNVDKDILSLSSNESEFEFYSDSSEEYKDNQKEFSDEMESFKTNNTFEESEDTTEDDYTVESSEEVKEDYDTRKKIAEKNAELILKDFTTKIVGNWKYSDHSSSWTTDDTLKFSDNGKIEINELKPLPDYLATNLNYSGTYTIDKEKIVTSLMEFEERYSDTSDKEMEDIQTYEQYESESLEPISLKISADCSGKMQGKDGYTEHKEAELGVFFKNESIELTQTSTLFTTNPGKFTRE